MKTTLRNTMILICLVALVGAMQAKAVDYTATPPAYEFQSTSVYCIQGNMVVPSMLNSDGSVNNSAYMSGPHRVGTTPTPGDNNGPGTPPTPPNPGQQPLGDGLLALMLMAFAYIFGRVFLKKRALKG
jgi:hypothetical protein